MPTPILDLSGTLPDVPPTTLTRVGSSNLGKDEFLKLLVAQLANQDPTKPEDSSQFVAQLAQFSALEQSQNMVSRLDTLLLGQATANQTNAASFIGKSITYGGGTVNLADAGSTTGTATLPTPADKITVTITDSKGTVVRTLSLGAHGAGDMAVDWDGNDDHGVRMPPGDYTVKPVAFDADGKAVPISFSVSGVVTGIAFQAGGLPVLKVGGSLVNMSDVTSINDSNERNTP